VNRKEPNLCQRNTALGGGMYYTSQCGAGKDTRAADEARREKQEAAAKRAAKTSAPRVARRGGGPCGAHHCTQPGVWKRRARRSSLTLPSPYSASLVSP
jgi:hypothetical protein